MGLIANWDIALAKAVRAQTKRPHDWGLNNCAMRAAELVEAITGREIAPAWVRARFAALGVDATARDAAAVMAELGCEGLADLAGLADLFLTRIDPADARRGDVVLMPGPAGEYLAVKTGVYAVGPGAPVLSASEIAARMAELTEQRAAAEADGDADILAGLDAMVRALEAWRHNPMGALYAPARDARAAWRAV